MPTAGSVRVHGRVTGLYEESDGPGRESISRRLVVEYAPGLTIDVGGDAACVVADVDRAPLADAAAALVGRLVAFLAVHGTGIGAWVPQQLDLDIERAHTVGAEDLPGNSGVYIIGSPDGVAFKIGTSIALHRRLALFQSGSVVPLYLYALLDGSYELETALHRRFKSSRLYGEVFAGSNDLRAFLAQHGLPEPLPIMHPGGAIEPKTNPPDLGSRLRALQEPQLSALPHRTAARIRASTPLTEPIPRLPPEVRERQRAARAERDPARRYDEFTDQVAAAVDAAIVRLVAQMPGALTISRPAHILWGSTGASTLADGHDKLACYGAFSNIVHRELYDRTKLLVASGQVAVTNGCLVPADAVSSETPTSPLPPNSSPSAVS